MANTVSNVTTGKPAAGGAIWRAPLGSTLPTSAEETLAAAFECLGYVSEDGYTNENSPETEDIKAWGGDIVYTTQTEKSDRFSFTLIEYFNEAVKKTVYGDNNVSGTLATGMTVRANSTEAEAAAYVIDQAMRGGVKQRTVIPNAKLSELAEITYKDDEVVGYGVTLTALPGGFGTGDDDTHKEYSKLVTTTSTT